MLSYSFVLLKLYDLTMKNFKLLITGILFLAFPLKATSYEASQFIGEWCFYEQELEGNVVEEKVTIIFMEDGKYLWSDIFWRQEGDWSVEGGILRMTDVGSHEILAINDKQIEVERLSIMKFKKGACS